MLNRLYVGSNNKTGRLEYAKAIRIAGDQFQGLTAFKGIGYWQGVQEKCVIIEIETEEKTKVRDLIRTLAKGLNQESIGWVILPKMQFLGV